MDNHVHVFVAAAGVRTPLLPATQAALERAKAESRIYVCIPRRCGRTMALKGYEAYLKQVAADG